ncbi:hypothetical protein CEXT_536681 [Caerostris extrusa]|uniref:Uncharacterized protein n=1 Tax=Caerostris extrusa TaxID=172846 RepID=A0AAV4QIW3_CAEEX|nr:hypothetical protein CEXT_536681 [Caerostris extrusa]
METVEDEWWRRMERAETMDYSVRESAPGASNPALMDTTCAAIQSERLASPTLPEKQSNLSDEEHCASITTVIKKKDVAQNLYDAYAAALTGYSPDDDGLKELKIRHDDLELAMREVSKLELCPLSSCKKHKIINFNSQIKRYVAHLNNHEHDNDGFLRFIYAVPKSLLPREVSSREMMAEGMDFCSADWQSPFQDPFTPLSSDQKWTRAIPSLNVQYHPTA